MLGTQARRVSGGSRWVGPGPKDLPKSSVEILGAIHHLDHIKAV